MFSTVLFGQTAVEPGGLNPDSGMNKGSADNPYEINELAHLRWISENDICWSENYYFVQTSDIKAGNTKNWNDGKGWLAIGRKIGQNIKPFKGSYDGGNFVIENLYINRTDYIDSISRDGFFGEVEGKANKPLVFNLGLINVNITSNAMSVGSLIGKCNTTNLPINNCFATGSIEIAKDQNTARTGGLIGMTLSSSAIEHCYAAVDITHYGSKTVAHAGGFVGYNGSSTYTNCLSFGKVTGNAPHIGGFVAGTTSPSSFISCYWNTDTSELYASAAGTGLTEKEMTDPNEENYPFSEWNRNVWVIESGEYPQLKGFVEDQTLPVELSSFTVNQFVNEGVELRWVAETETNFLGYNVYRSEGLSLSNAEKVNFAIIPGYNTSVRNSYKYEDTTVELEKEYFYWLEGVDLDLTNEFHGPISIYVQDMTEGGAEFYLPPVTRLVGAYPNPFNPSTNIYFSLDKGKNVTIDIYNAQGQFIENICTDRYFDKGGNSVTWSGSNLASGVYYINLRAGAETMQKKMLLLK